MAFDWFEYIGRDSTYELPNRKRRDYRNPILAGYYPDPSVTRVGDKYYLVNSTFAHWPGIPIHESTDLVHWKLIGHALSDPPKVSFDGLNISRGVFAPSIHFHKGIYYVINTLVDAGGNFFVTADESRGPLVRARVAQGNRRHRSVVLLRRRRQGIHRQQRAARRRAALRRPSRHLDPGVRSRRLTSSSGPRKVIVNGGVDIAKKPIWIEGPHLYRIKGWYYLMCAEGGTEAGHSEVIFRSKSPWGPFEPWTWTIRSSRSATCRRIAPTRSPTPGTPTSSR